MSKANVELARSGYEALMSGDLQGGSRNSIVTQAGRKPSRA
jgi:hypothetical protein